MKVITDEKNTGIIVGGNAKINTMNNGMNMQNTSSTILLNGAKINCSSNLINNSNSNSTTNISNNKQKLN
jgi:hypothetical protein